MNLGLVQDDGGVQMHDITRPELLTSHFAVRDCEGTNRAHIG